jgi:DNA-binding MarR family transcriptional regulator
MLEIYRPEFPGKQGERKIMLKITDLARDKIKEALKQHPQRTLRVIFDGLG